MARTDYKLTLVKIDFSINAYKNIQKKTLNDWVQQPKIFFHFIESFGELENPNGKVSIWMLEDPKNWNFYSWTISIILFWKRIWTKQKQ